VVTPQLTGSPADIAPSGGVPAALPPRGDDPPDPPCCVSAETRDGAGGVSGSGGAGYARNRVFATAAIVTAVDARGVTRLPVLQSQAPLVLRRTLDAVYLVGGAAGPIGGDTLDLRIDVRAGAVLRVRTAAASVALPGPDGLESVLTVTVTVGPGACLEYLPEPVVVAAGARHATVIRATLAEGASLLLRDELILGRHGEPGGASRTTLRVDYAGRPLLRQSLEVSGTDEASLGPAILAGHRAAGTLLHVDPALHAAPAGHAGPAVHAGSAPGPGPAPQAGPEVAVMPLAGPAILVTALAHDAVTLRQRLALP
jgi:urease accessory protein